MHEFSIATALADLAEAHAPAGTVVQAVKMRAGPLRGVDPQAMQMAWQAVCQGRPRCDGAVLQIELTPWLLRCAGCGSEFASDDPLAACACGSERTHPVGGDELRLIALTVSDPIERAADSPAIRAPVSGGNAR